MPHNYYTPNPRPQFVLALILTALAFGFAAIGGLWYDPDPTTLVVQPICAVLNTISLIRTLRLLRK